MYKQIEAAKTAKLENGCEITPIATLMDTAGGVAHIWVDDHCYQLGLESSAEAKSDGEMVCESYVVPVTHIFAEAFDVLKLLPSLSNKNEASKLWAVNIPPEPDSELFYPVPSFEIAQELTERLKKEVKERFKLVGEWMSENIYFQEWKGTPQEHADYLKNNPNWWDHTTFLDEKMYKDVHDKTNDLIQRAENYLEKFSSSGKIAESLIQELINQLKATDKALFFMTDCHKEWSKMAIKQKAHIERVDAIAKQQIAYHQSYVDKYINNDVERANRHIERINAWQSIISCR